jgi:hypothetical protein
VSEEPKDEYDDIDPDVDYFKRGLVVCAGMIIFYIAGSYIISLYS